MYNLYLLTSSLDNKIYIGITNNPERRYYEHINYTIEKTYYNGNWIRKTLQNGGKIKMTILLSNLLKRKAIELEIEMIRMFKKIAPEYCTNTSDGGLGFNHKGIPHSEEHKKSLEMAQPHKVRIPNDVLYDLYINQKLSKKKIGEIYGCGATTIDRRLIEYKIKTRKTPNYKISYKINKEEVLDMFLNKRMSISKISEYFSIGQSGIRYLLQREGIDTSLNRNKISFKREDLESRFLELINQKIKKMHIYEILSNEFNISSSYISKILDLRSIIKS